MIDTGTIRELGNEGKTIIDMLTTAIIGVIVVITYVAGFFSGKKKSGQ